MSAQTRSDGSPGLPSRREAVIGAGLAGLAAGHGAAFAAPPRTPLPIERQVENRTARNGAVNIHYAAMGRGPLVVLIHGFPDYWLTWREQMPALASRHRVAAMDQRGYNLSGRPAGDAEYATARLVEDVAAVIRANQAERAVIVGHDWGGWVAWNVALTRPELVERLVVLNLPHPTGLARTLESNPEQQKAAGYVGKLQEPGAAKQLSPEALADWTSSDPAVHAAYLEAMRRSDIDAMLAYYRMNYPKPPFVNIATPQGRVRCPTLLFHGLKDKNLPADALNDTWKWLDGSLTLVTTPEAGHFVHRDAPRLVSDTMVDWLARASV